MISQEILKTILSYDSNTGLFTRISGPKAGSVAGHLRKKDGYVMIGVLGRSMQAHRLAWLYVYGFWPSDIDHKDRNRSNNAISNLREATQSQNNMNTGLGASNTSGFKGVTWNRSSGKWQAQAKLNGKCHYLGLFPSAEGASLAYQDFCRRNHGDFLYSQRGAA